MEMQVLTVERTHVDVGGSHLERLHDLLPDGSRRCSSQRHDWYAGQGATQGCKLKITGSEVMPPFADTVGLVDGQERDAPGRLKRHEAIQEPLKRLWAEVHSEKVSSKGGTLNFLGALCTAQQAGRDTPPLQR
jgi:hypothetical protein